MSLLTRIIASARIHLLLTAILLLLESYLYKETQQIPLNEASSVKMKTSVKSKEEHVAQS